MFSILSFLLFELDLEAKKEAWERNFCFSFLFAARTKNRLGTESWIFIVFFGFVHFPMAEYAICLPWTMLRLSVSLWLSVLRSTEGSLSWKQSMVDVAVGCNSNPAPDPAHLALVLSTHNLQQTASEDTAQIGHMEMEGRMSIQRWDENGGEKGREKTRVFQELKSCVLLDFEFWVLIESWRMSCWFSFVGLVLTKSMVSNGSRWTWIQKIAILLGDRFLPAAREWGEILQIGRSAYGQAGGKVCRYTINKQTKDSPSPVHPCNLLSLLWQATTMIQAERQDMQEMGVAQYFHGEWPITFSFACIVSVFKSQNDHHIRISIPLRYPLTPVFLASLVFSVDTHFVKRCYHDRQTVSPVFAYCS